ncbi:MAG: hypothetical protein QM503_04650 [Bacteroidota bacterium]
MQTLINITESILKIEMGTMKITIEVNNPPDTLVRQILESKTPIIPSVSAPKPDNTSDNKPDLKITEKTPETTTQKKPGKTQNRVAVSKKCLNCNNEFAPTTNAQKYCTPVCKTLFKNKQLDATLEEIKINQDKNYEFAERI